MMKYPKLNEIPTSRDILDKFKGYNHNLRIGDGEFYDMKNLTGDYYPVLSPRKKRGIYLTPNKPNGMCSNTQFCYVDGQDFYIGDKKYDLKLTDTPKDLVSIGAVVTIMPDQKYINTVNLSQTGHMRVGVYDLPKEDFDSGKTPKLAFALKEPRDVLIVRRGESLPDPYDAYNGKYPDLAIVWNTSITPAQYKCVHVERKSTGDYKWYSGWSTTDSWGELDIVVYGVDDDATYFSQTLESIFAESTKNTATISGVPNLESKVYGISRGNPTKYPNGALQFRVLDKMASTVLGDEATKKNEFIDWLIADSGSIFSPRVVELVISIETPASKDAAVPKLDHMIESGNRLWGCRYGTNNNGDFVNEIYASKLGDFKDWVPLEDATVATSAYSVPVGTSGAFTGAINYGGKPIFFKEDCMHRVFGDFPANYQVQTIMCKGVQEGCAKSLAIVNDVLYYKSRSGICAFDGSLPVEISMQFGDKQYKNAVAGAIGDKYYVSMQDESGKWHMFAYDTIKRLWHREDDTQATQFCNHKGELYYIDYADNNIHTVKGTGVIETDPIPWSAETGILGANTPDNKYVSRLDLRMSIARGSELAVYIEYDSMGDWEKIADIEGLTLNTFTIPVQPRRCDHFRLKFVGEGEAKIFSISKVLEESE